MKDQRIDVVALSLAIVACIVAGLMRYFPLEWNFAPVGALALFAGARLRGGLAFVIPMVLLLCTDAALAGRFGYSFLHEGILWNASSYLLAVLLGRSLRNSENPLFIGGMGLACSIQFFLITNFGAWINLAFVNPHMPYSYAPTAAGLFECYIKGLPFYRGTLAGDLLFTAILFGSHAYLIRVFPAYRLQPAHWQSVLQDDAEED